MSDLELVVLVDNHDQPVGTALKAAVHTDKTPLHRAFSLFLFNNKGEVLVQERARAKKTWPGIWSNSCCGHPKPGETTEAAIHRRLYQELGCQVSHLQKVSDYRYNFEFRGIVENEICPIYKGVISGTVHPNPAEVEDYRWLSWSDLLTQLSADTTDIWSPWCKEEVQLFK